MAAHPNVPRNPPPVGGRVHAVVRCLANANQLEPEHKCVIAFTLGAMVSLLVLFYGAITGRSGLIVVALSILALSTIMVCIRILIGFQEPSCRISEEENRREEGVNRHA